MNFASELGLLTLVLPLVSTSTLALVSIAVAWLFCPILGWSLLGYWLLWGAS